ncbi:hypothetical protein pEaSNUABM50_00015 [Erwinia phage pEa_SNUABM_50]|uniref:Uncharacterized protein n=4 Tax=Eneladusvirus BF TaxID=2560751 RepID=A0A7L8ZN79_9CAUD|nr:hypothetical protein FDH34_gp016 [Serratia phage BF]QOI70954.1 hypothetical protein pEaSNUABM12_00016 [Erwinia phage pEa_SNUABM_12]QOI71499.1 hypothetical protein pEaSNUABM47_00015 [Erwinia phage pEa_SNUABM_47]QOI72039.1 hypothetical protein pEaSNUABM50_00015 [Erwinia phage pEa_SNUABM_50]QXO11162.1 hypothetical protein pEaSNUABM19_00016 [Erwinia phage pEa_SNUABM_19]QXO11710.1 hypothetical protein pEaSNUABM44_00014 [Erwinia phage pEa_SNUABM_44]QXO12260.1 hypothetical protein pEaSNUABM49_000
MKAYEHKTMTVADLIAKLESTYPNKNAVIVADLWDEDDIREVAQDINIQLDREECRVVAAYLDDTADKTNGYNDDNIKLAIYQVINLGLINP